MEPISADGPVLTCVADLLERPRDFEESLHEIQGVVVTDVTGGVLEVPRVVGNEEETVGDLGLIEVQVVGKA